MTDSAIVFDASTLPLTSNQLIEASAGTGKTYSITNLCLRLLLGRGRPALAINEILILTFTIAATDELKHRVAKRIQQAKQAFSEGRSKDEFLDALIAESPDPLRDRKLLAAAAQMMDEASIFTIHGFCARVLGEQAFESGILFDQALNAERDQLLQAAAEDCFRSHIMTMEPGLRDLAISIWAGPDALARALSPYLFRGELMIFPNAVSMDPADVLELARQAKQGWLDHELPGILRAADLRANSRVLSQLDAMTAFCRSPETDLNHEYWQLYSAESLAGARKKSSTLAPHPVLEQIDQVHQQKSGLKVWLWQSVMAQVRARIDQAKADTHKMTLDDLLSLTAAAVNRPGSTLAEVIARRWPVAMIDEFQDTDAIQYAIFSRVYPVGSIGPSEQSLLMIGDPKQAIYNFRGADVYTYINARREAAGKRTLDTNWRSSPAMIEATNLLFSTPGLFGDEADMPFHPVHAAEPNQQMKMQIAGNEVSPYQLFVAADIDDHLNVGPALERTMSYAAEQAVSLLNSDDVLIDDKPVHAGQIAFLVRSRRDALAAQNALARRGVNSVYLTLESVFLQDTAYDLKLILEAIAEPTNDQAVRTAMATRLMQCTASEINDLNHDVQLQQKVLLEFREYHKLWQEKDVAPMLNRLMTNRCLAEKWLCQQDGERQITNLRHLVELLQSRSSTVPGMFQLIKWFGQEQRDAETVDIEERQLRLESDQDLVKIVTMHAAKGLEYDVVMIPMPVFGEPKNTENTPALFHELQQERFFAALELGDDQAHRDAARREEKEEEIRLLYVALTRAKYRCYLGVPKLRHFARHAANRSALAQLLGIPEVGKSDDLDQVMASLQSGGELPAHLFEIVPASNTRQSPITPLREARTTDSLSPPPERPTVTDFWRIHSYTGVAARIQQAHHQPVEFVTGFTDDDVSDADENISREPQQQQRNRFNFPRGPRAGIALHSLMEDVDFRDNTNHEGLCNRVIRRLSLEDEWLPVLGDWLHDILATPLGDHALADIDQTRRLDEMEFHFPLAAQPGLISYLIEKGFVDNTASTSIRLDGLMTGLIDLLYCHDGRYYVVDYKSNHLGNTVDNYAEAQLSTAMHQHQYHLQYLIYTVAVHRMLKLKLPGYRYSQHFGGVRYLFLRGMSGLDGMNGGGQTGVFSTLPPEEIINDLDLLLGGQG